jgi:hypothetical protein
MVEQTDNSRDGAAELDGHDKGMLQLAREGLRRHRRSSALKSTSFAPRAGSCCTSRKFTKPLCLAA